MSHKDEDFLKLQKIWYKKLESSGFNDIEDTRSDDRLLKEWDFNFFRNQFNQTVYEAKLIYYERAHSLLHTYEFKSPVHRQIWKLHCDGISERKIAEQVRYYKKSMVHYVIDQISRAIKESS